MTTQRTCFSITLLVLAAIGVSTNISAAQAPVAVPAWRQATRLAVIPITGEFDTVSRASVERRVNAAAAAGCNAAVLEIDTPGGDMYATLELCLWLKDRAPLPVWAWIHTKAYSAGTIIALACRGILVSPGAAFGDAAPISVLPGMGLQPLPVAERAKLEAPVLAEVVDSARRNGYDETLVRAFISAPDEVWLLQRIDGSSRIFIGRQEYIDAFGQDPPITRAAGADRPSFAESGKTEPFFDLSLRRNADDGPNNSAERDILVEDQQVRPPTRARLAKGAGSEWRVVGQVDGAQELLITYAPEALAFGLAQTTVGTDQELMNYFGSTSVVRLDENFADAFIRFLTSWPVRLALVVVVLGGFIIELVVPGFGWFGGAAAIALALLIGAPALAGVVAWWPLLIVLTGGALILIEVFVVPGVGIVGFLGGACVLVGLVASFLDAPLATPEGRNDLAAAIGIVATGGIVAGALAWALLRALPRSQLFRGAILETTAGNIGIPTNAESQATALIEVGTRGTAVSPLRPVGKAAFQHLLIDVQAVGPFIDAGAAVIVVRATAYAVEVEAA